MEHNSEDQMNAVASKTKDVGKQDAPDANYQTPKRLAEPVDPFATTKITVSGEAADFAYQLFASPYSNEWRMAGACFDAGMLRGVEKYKIELDCLENVLRDRDRFVDRLEGELQEKDLRIAELEQAVREAQQVIDDAWNDAPEPGVEAFRAVLPHSPEKIAEWDTLAKGPIEHDTPGVTPGVTINIVTDGTPLYIPKGFHITGGRA